MYNISMIARVIKSSRYFLGGLVLGIIYCALSVVYGFDPFVYAVKNYDIMGTVKEFCKVDELFFLCILPLVGLVLDLTRRSRRNLSRLRTEEAMLRTLKATVHTIEDSVLNTYNGLQLLLEEARKKGVSVDLLEAIEKNIEKSVNEIIALRTVSEVRERETRGGINYIDTGSA